MASGSRYSTTQNQNSSAFTGHVLDSAVLSQPNGPGHPPLCSPLHTERARSCKEFREIIQHALLLCAQSNKNIPTNFKQVHTAAHTYLIKYIRSPLKALGRYGSYLKTGEHITWASFKVLKIEKNVLIQRERVFLQHHGGRPPQCPRPSGLQQFLQEESVGLRGKVVCVFKNQANGFCCLVGNKNHIIFGFNFLREEKRKAKAFLIPHVTIHTWRQVSFIEYVPARAHDRPCFTGGETEAQKSEPTMKPAKPRP